MVLGRTGHVITEDPVDPAAILATMARLLRPDVVVMDLAMPVMDGRQAMQALRADERTARIPIAVRGPRPAAATAARPRRPACR